MMPKLEEAIPLGTGNCFLLYCRCGTILTCVWPDQEFSVTCSKCGRNYEYKQTENNRGNRFVITEKST